MQVALVLAALWFLTRRTKAVPKQVSDTNVGTAAANNLSTTSATNFPTTYRTMNTEGVGNINSNPS